MRSFPIISVFGLGLMFSKNCDFVSDANYSQVNPTSTFPNPDLTRPEIFKSRILHTNRNRTDLTTYPIDSEAVCFRTLVCRSKFFIDNSLLIDYLFRNNKILVTLPRAFGKTINLSMLKTFFQIEINRTSGERLKLEQMQSHNIFVKGELNCDEFGMVKLQDEFLINNSNYTDVMVQMGSKPVIYLDLGVSDILQDIETFMKDCLECSLLEHEYIKLRIPRYEAYHEKYVELLEQLDTSAVEDLPKILPHLAEILENIFHEKVVVLIDDYDRLLNKIFLNVFDSNQDQRIKDTVSFFNSFYESLINDTTSIQYVFVTGQLAWTDLKIFSEFVLNTAAGGEVFKFYGFEDKQVEVICKEMCYEQYLPKIKEYFRGYNFGIAKELIKYNPYSINTNINNMMSMSSFRKFTKDVDVIAMMTNHLIKYSNFNKMLYRILIGGYISIPIQRLKENATSIISISSDDFRKLFTALRNATRLNEIEWYCAQNYDSEIGFKILYVAGYLTRTHTKESSHRIDPHRNILAKIPNSEVENYLWSLYSSSLGIPQAETNDKAHHQQLYDASMDFNKILTLVLQTNYSNGKNFAIQLKKLMNSYPPIGMQISGFSLHNTGRIIESLIETHILYSVHKFNMVAPEVEPAFSWAVRSRPDVVLITREKRMVIIEFRKNNTISLNETMHQLKKYAIGNLVERNSRFSGPIYEFKLVAIIVRKALKKRIEVNVETLLRSELESILSSNIARKKLRSIGKSTNL